MSAALSLHFEVPELGLTYENCVRYIKVLGASHISVGIQASMKDIHASSLSFTDQESTKMEDLSGQRCL